MFICFSISLALLFAPLISNALAQGVSTKLISDVGSDSLSISRTSPLPLAAATSPVHHSGAQDNLVKLITRVERQHRLPRGLLLSIAKVESNINPNAICLEGKAMLFSSKEQALKLIKEQIAKGVKNIDVGVMQVNYKYHYHGTHYRGTHYHGAHSREFEKIEDMLDPVQNVQYAAKLLVSLYKKHKSWQQAVRYYHSANKVHHEKYSKKIILSWLSL